MIRWLYRCLLWLHPALFREQFADEMLAIFDEAAGAVGASPFFADGLASLTRQWLLRTGMWKAAAGSVGALVMIVGMMGMAAFPVRHVSVPDLLEEDLPEPASSGPPAEFSGHWAGTILFPGPAGQIEITLNQSGDAWHGELQVRGMDGVAHPGVAEDIRAGGNALSFRFKTNRGDMIYRGRMTGGRLRGYVRPADTTAF